MVVSCVPPPVAAAAFTAMRMNKSGTYAPPPFSALTQVTGWGADGAYSGTVITGNALVLADAGTGKTVSGACAWTSTFTGTMYAQLYKNGVAFGSEQSMSGTSGTFTFSHTGQTVAASDTWAMYVRDPTGISMVVQAAGTFLKVE
jgi:hypothetical protein